MYNQLHGLIIKPGLGSNACESDPLVTKRDIPIVDPSKVLQSFSSRPKDRCAFQRIFFYQSRQNETRPNADAAGKGNALKPFSNNIGTIFSEQ